MRKHFDPKSAVHPFMPSRSNKSGSYYVNMSAAKSSITRTCRLLRTEFLSVLFASTHLEFCCSLYRSSPANPQVYHDGYHSTFPTDLLRHIRQLSIQADFPLDRILKDFIRLESLTITEVDVFLDKVTALDFLDDKMLFDWLMDEAKSLKSKHTPEQMIGDLITHHQHQSYKLYLDDCFFTDYIYEDGQDPCIVRMPAYHSGRLLTLDCSTPCSM